MAATLYGLLGWPVGHSVSPAMVNSAFQRLDLRAYYTAFAVVPEDFEAAVRGLAALRAGGANVTIPHKQQARDLATGLTDEAKLAGAVNTLKFIHEAKEILGHNTDVAGWWTSLITQSGNHRDWQRVIVLGAGGASRAVFAGLSLHVPKADVGIAARNPDQALQMAKEFSSHLSVHPVEWTYKENEISTADLVINTTPAGMWPDVEDSPLSDDGCFQQGQVVQDLVYRPLRTRFLQMAFDRGATVVEGLSMLVEQGAQAVEWWTGRVPDREDMRRAALAALGISGTDKVGSDSI